jgi:hypothetical protein
MAERDLGKEENTFISCLPSNILNRKIKGAKSLNVIRHFAETELKFYDYFLELFCYVIAVISCTNCNVEYLVGLLGNDES